MHYVSATRQTKVIFKLQKAFNFVSNKCTAAVCWRHKNKAYSEQGCNVRKVNCGCVYSAYILKPVLSGRNL